MGGVPPGFSNVGDDGDVGEGEALPVNAEVTLSCDTGAELAAGALGASSSTVVGFCFGLRISANGLAR